MDWRTLEAHFRAATHQDPAPFGDDAVEWDYSRYARALGLTGQPGLHDLPHRGCAVVAVRPALWDGAARKYRKWSREAGWTVLRVSARPTVGAPDPVVYALGKTVAGEDSLIFARSGQGGDPAVGERSRSPAMSVPLTSGERWLIAADRVRRRVRNEAAVRGLVVFVDEAHKLTAAGLAMLVHQLDAHCAWQARMLSRDAKVYVVFATPPDRERGFVESLARFGVRGAAPVRRERAKRKGAPGPQAFDVEEEHLLAALAGAPLALAEDDVARLFGASARERMESLLERDAVRRRAENGVVCLVPDPAIVPELPAPTPRVLEALLQRYRERMERGHQHLVLAAAALEFRVGRPLRAAALVGRASPANTATVALDLCAELEAGLAEVAESLHASHVAVWFALCAHRRAYEEARALAYRITERDLRTPREMYRTLTQLLCTGRTHLDAALPDDFWPALKSTRIDGAFVDAACILAELFARLRLMKPIEIQQRYEVACECLNRSDGDPMATRLRRLIDLLQYRAAVSLRAFINPRVCVPTCVGPDAAREAVFGRACPAYVIGTLIYAEIQGRHHSQEPTFDHVDRFTALDFARATGNHFDSRIQMSGVLQRLTLGGGGLLTRHIAEEQLLAVPTGAHHVLRRGLCLDLQAVVGLRTWLASANTLVLSDGIRNAIPGSPFEVASMSRLLLDTGDFAGARDCLRTTLFDSVESPGLLALLLVSKALWARKTLNWNELDDPSQVLAQHRSKLPREYGDYVEAFLAGSCLLCARSLREAESEFRIARECFKNTGTGHMATLRLLALDSEVLTRVLRKWFEGTHSSTTEALSGIVERLAKGRSGPLATRVAREASVAPVFDFLAIALELWAQLPRASETDDALRVAILLRKRVEAGLHTLGKDLLSTLARQTPLFYQAVETVVRRRVGALVASAPSTRAVASAMNSLERVFDTRLLGRKTARQRRTRAQCLLVNSVSRKRQVRHVACVWPEDATTLARVTASLREHIGNSEGFMKLFTGYGYIGAHSATPSEVEILVEARWSGKRVCRFRIADRGERQSALRAGDRTRPQHVPTRCHRDRFRGRSAAAAELRRLIALAARCDYPTLVTGETGAGKEVVAASIHALSHRAGSKLVVADCAVTVDTLLESELFGHERGSFTGAFADHAGYFERAHGSTLFLDEVDSMSPRMQAALLRVLETGEYRPVGGTGHRRSDFRLIAAALPRLFQRIALGGFREDLFYRLSVLRIHVPPLRERENDASSLAVDFARVRGCALTTKALRIIDDCSWPGNVRQLKHCIDAASLWASDSLIGATAVEDAISACGTDPSAVWRKNTRRSATEVAWSRALETIQADDKFDARVFAKAAGVSRRSAQRHLANLVRLGRVSRLGAGRGTMYSVRDEKGLS